MEIYLLRHGAADRNARDADRRLTDLGIAEVIEVITQARQTGFNPSLILSSPYTRALETAKLTARLLDYQQEILTAAALIPESTPQDVWDELRLYGDQPSILAVTHEPLVTAIASWMLSSARTEIEFKTATLARIDIETMTAKPRGVRRWTIDPTRA
jgi:phosphohistidine phosphatase